MSEVKDVAKTLKSMCVGFLENSINEDAFSANLQVFAKACSDIGESTSDFVFIFNSLAKMINEISIKNGWVNKDSNDAEQIAFMHSDISDVLMSVWYGITPSDNIAKFSTVEEKLADVIIRIMDYSVENKYNVSEAIMAKIKVNAGR